MAVERTFAIIKPDAVKKKVAGQILARIEASGLDIIAIREQSRHRDGSRLARLVKPVDGGIGVPDGDARLRKHRCGGGFPHADRPGQAQPEGHACSTALRVASSTSGRMPNQRSKPGAA